MVKQTNNQNLQEITGIISSAISTSIADSKTAYNKQSSSFQINSNSTGCNNIKVSGSSTTYTASSDAVASSTVYQSVVASIVNQITSKQNNKAAGGLFDKQDNNLAASIMNIVQTKLNQTTIASIGNVANISDTSVQVCVDASGGNNILFTSENDIFTYYNTVYSSSSTVQSVAADISNMIAADQGNKSTGIIALIVYAIIAIAIVLVVLIGGGMLLYMMTVL